MDYDGIESCFILNNLVYVVLQYLFYNSLPAIISFTIYDMPI